MHRRTLAAVVLSLCAAGAAAPTIATASAAPAIQVADIKDGTSNTIMATDAGASTALSLNFTKITYVTF